MAVLSAGGQALWEAVTTNHPDLSPEQQAQLLEACRLKDRLDDLDTAIRGRVDGWERLIDRANGTANQMKQLFAALRLPDEVTGKRPQQRGGARGAYAKGSGTVSSLDRARQRAGA